MGIIVRVLVAGDSRSNLGGGGHRPPSTGPQPEQVWSKEMPPASAGAKKPPEQGQAHRGHWRRYDSGGTAGGGEGHSRAVQWETRTSKRKVTTAADPNLLCC